MIDDNLNLDTPDIIPTSPHHYVASSDAQILKNTPGLKNESYREPVSLDDMPLGGSKAILADPLSDQTNNVTPLSSNSSSTGTQNSDSFTIDATASVIQNTSASSLTNTPSQKTTITPQSSVAEELRKQETRSPIERGPAPHLQAIKESIAREKNLLNPDETTKKTLPGDPLFAPNVIKSQEKSSEEITAETTRTQEAISRGLEKAEVAGKKQILKSLRTFQSDIADAMQTQQPSMVQKVLAEHHTNEDKKEKVILTKKKNSAFFAGAIALVILGTGVLTLGGWYWYTHTATINPAKNDISVPTLFFTETKKEMQSDGLETTDLRNTIGRTITSTDLFIDSIAQIYVTETLPPATSKDSPTKVVVSTERLLSLINSSIPSWLTRSLGPVYMLGVHVWNGNQPFFVFTTTTELFDNTFSGMLKWEPTMARDLFPVFGIKQDSLLLEKPWEDMIIKNRDVRTLTDPSGNIVLLYTFYDRQTLIITTSPDTMDEIVQRIIQEKRK